MKLLKLLPAWLLFALALCGCGAQSLRQVPSPRPSIPALGIQKKEPTFCRRLLSEFIRLDAKVTELCESSISASTDTTQ